MYETNLSMHITVFGFGKQLAWMRNEEPAGIVYEARHLKYLDLINGRTVNDLKKSLSHKLHDMKTEAANIQFDVDDLKFLQSLDPRHWKEQDHYKVLGLFKLRFEATADQIKNAYRQKVLFHHPDKRKARGELVLQDDYFAAITKAYEVLSDQDFRAAFDSVDPLFDDSLPSATVESDQYYANFGPVFERNSRWSKKKPVPQLGDPNSSKEYVNAFYKFWYDFDSWREFSYLDEEDKQRGDCREERKWIEKQNKIKRMERRKEEIGRIRRLVDSSYGCDPRIQHWKQEEKNQRAIVKQQKEEIQRLDKLRQLDNQKLIDEHDRKVAEQKEKEIQEKTNIEKKMKMERKKESQKVKKSIEKLCESRGICTDDLQQIQLLQKLFHALSLEQINELHVQLTNADGRELEIIEEFDKMITKQHERSIYSNETQSTAKSKSKLVGAWKNEQVQLLVRAVSLFPAGTPNRWDVVASFINEKSQIAEVLTSKDVLSMVKLLQKQTAVKHNSNEADSTCLSDVQGPVLNGCDGGVNDESSTNKEVSWSAMEQKQLEQALKSVPANDPDRWNKIANCVPGRTKKQCIERYKVLTELVKAKKLALAQK